MLSCRHMDDFLAFLLELPYDIFLATINRHQPK